MDLYCTRPGCTKPVNPFPDLDDPATLKTVQQKYCTSCGMPLILIGHYLPQKLLGQGGFGAAFLARDRYTPGLRRCVVKQFQPVNTLTPAQLQVAQHLFEREAEVLEQLGNHAQIPDLFSFFDLTVPGWQPGKQEKFFYLVQEFIDGQTLEEELAQKGILSSQEVLEILQAILPVLQYVHENGSIHRDIKPSNIMRHRNGRIYLLDFGAVRQATKAGTHSTSIYSEGFAPPEQMGGREVYPSSDLYALAVTCIMLLTNKLPQDLLDTYSNTWQWRKDAPTVSKSLADVLDRMLRSAPSERFQSATEVLQVLSMPAAKAPVVRSKSAPAPPANPPGSGGSSSASSSTSMQPSAPVNPGSATPVPAAPANVAPVRPAIAPFSTMELLASAGFTGFEAGLVGIALISLLGTSLISGGFWVVLLAGLVFAQSRRLIERMDLVILSGMSLVLVLLVSPLRQAIAVPLAGSPLLTVLFIAGMAGLGAIAATILFRLIFKVISRFL